MNYKFTPENITSLGRDEVFVFGSNLGGNHAGGAARVARERFGAIMGQGEGMQGQSYAIPTMQGGVDTIKTYVDDFIKFAQKHSDMTFYVTRIGCGIAGFKDEEIAPLFDVAFDYQMLYFLKHSGILLIMLDNLQAKHPVWFFIPCQ